MELTPDTIDAWLYMLREHGVKEFNCALFSVKLHPEETSGNSGDNVVGEINREPEYTGPLWKNPRLWAGGEPPKFPGQSAQEAKKDKP